MHLHQGVLWSCHNCTVQYRSFRNKHNFRLLSSEKRNVKVCSGLSSQRTTTRCRPARPISVILTLSFSGHGIALCRSIFNPYFRERHISDGSPLLRMPLSSETPLGTGATQIDPLSGVEENAGYSSKAIRKIPMIRLSFYSRKNGFRFWRFWGFLCDPSCPLWLKSSLATLRTKANASALSRLFSPQIVPPRHIQRLRAGPRQCPDHLSTRAQCVSPSSQCHRRL